MNTIFLYYTKEISYYTKVVLQYRFANAFSLSLLEIRSLFTNNCYGVFR